MGTTVCLWTIQKSFCGSKSRVCPKVDVALVDYIKDPHSRRVTVTRETIQVKARYRCSLQGKPWVATMLYGAGKILLETYEHITEFAAAF